MTQPAPLIILSSDWRAFRFPLPLSQNTHTHTQIIQISYLSGSEHWDLMWEATAKCTTARNEGKKQLKWENRVLFFSPLFGIKWWCKIWQEHPAIPCVNKGRLSPSRGLKRRQNAGVSGYASWPWIGKNLSVWGKGLCWEGWRKVAFAIGGLGFGPSSHQSFQAYSVLWQLTTRLDI